MGKRYDQRKLLCIKKKIIKKKCCISSRDNSPITRFGRFFLYFKIKLLGDQEGLFKLTVQLRKFFNSVIYNTATGYVLLVYLTNI
jgi:hypothetical protein